MLQIKNTLGGGKPEGLYVWKKSAQIKVADDTQTKLANMPTGGYMNSAVSFDGKIYVFGSGVPGYGTKVQKYDSESNSWSYGDDMPYSYLEGSVVVYNNKVHVLGGYTSQTNHYSFDGTTWTSESILPYQFFRGTACVYNNKIHILGGYSDSGTNNGLAYHYSWDGSEWKQESTLPYSMRHGACTVYNGKIHLLGGYGATSNHYSWDGSSWYNEGNMSNGTYCAEAHTYRNCIYVFGGMYASTSLYKWDGNTWSSITLTSGGFAWAPSVIHNDNLYIMGSNNSSYRGQFYKILGYKNENVFLNYVVSDKETAYPDGAVHTDGYWYERVVGNDLSNMVKRATETIVFDNLTFASDTSSYEVGYSDVKAVMVCQISSEVSQRANAQAFGYVRQAEDTGSDLRVYSYYYNSSGTLYHSYGSNASLMNGSAINFGFKAGWTYKVIIWR